MTPTPQYATDAPPLGGASLSYMLTPSPIEKVKETEFPSENSKIYTTFVT